MAKRRLTLKRKTNNELFQLYFDRLKVTLSPGQHYIYTLILQKFYDFLGEFPPSVELAFRFLAGYADRSQATRVRYTGMINGFMKWYGEPVDFKPRRPKKLPEYINPSDIERIIDVIRSKRSFRDTIERDVLLVRVATLTGLRRAEVARLTVRDINLERRLIHVRKGKGEKDRYVPLAASLAESLSGFLAGRNNCDANRTWLAGRKRKRRSSAN